MNLCTRNRQGFGYGCKKAVTVFAVTHISLKRKYSNFLSHAQTNLVKSAVTWQLQRMEGY